MINFLRILIALTVFIFSTTSFAVDESTLLKADQAFQVSLELEQLADATEPSTIVVKWNIADNYYMYQKKIKLSFDDSSEVALGSPNFPPSTRMDDPAYGDVEIHRNLLVARFPLKNYNVSNTVMLKTKYQGCADVGVCYPPVKKTFDLKSLNIRLLGSTSPSHGKTSQPNSLSLTQVKPELSEQDSIAASLASDNFFLTFISFFGFGLLLAFTPCVFPMIPILSGIIIGQGKQLSTRRAFSLSLAYVLAMALAYTVVGVLAALFGTNLQIWFQNPWILGSFAGIFVLLSLSMFGFYELQMPAVIQNKLNSISDKQEGGKLAGAALMGLLSALIVGPCVTAPLIGALIYIGQTGNTLLGGSALFALGLGMGAPLLVIGTSAGKFLPNAGAWMNIVKSVFGILMLAVAIWLLSRILPSVVTQLLWATLLLVSSIYLGALRQHNDDTTSWQLFWKGLGFTMFSYSTLMIIGAATGKANLLHPLASLNVATAGETIEDKGIRFKAIKSESDLDSVLVQAKKTGQSVMLDFYADWCISCKEMEETTFKDSAVKAALADSISIQADVTANDDTDNLLLKRFNIIGPPAILFFDPSGKELKVSRVVGYTPADKFSKHVEKALF